MKTTNFLITALVIMLGFSSCTNDADTQSKTDLISSKSWNIKSKTVEPSISFGGMEISDIRVLDSEDVRSYYFEFSSDGTLLQYDASNSLIFQTTWTFNSDETELTFTEPIMYTYPVVGDIGITTLSIKSITSSEIVGTIPAFYDGVDYLVTITFK